MTTTTYIRPEGKWLVRQLAAQSGESEAEVEAALNQLIEHGHMRVLHGIGPDGCDAFEPIIKGEDTTGVRIGEDDDDAN